MLLQPAQEGLPYNKTPQLGDITARRHTSAQEMDGISYVRISDIKIETRVVRLIKRIDAHGREKVP